MTDRRDDAPLLAYDDTAHRVPVLWIHGYPLSGALWGIQTADLADIARQITPDLRGHGRSAATPPPYAMAQLADDCIGVLDHLEIPGPVVVGGLSMGGYVAFEICRRHPGRVAGLILAATRAGADSDEARSARDQAAETARSEGVATVVDGMLPKLFAPENLVAQAELVDAVRAMMLETSVDGMVGALAAMRDRPDSTADLPGFDVPALVLHGAEDQLIPVAEAEAMAGALPDAELSVIPDAGHLPNLERPEEFNEAVREFLEGYYEE